ncbi:MAG: hypothetical protein IJF32_07790 [Oscillospiraceae bacterium]|nr:hypothetical protein [Oscillospiraceae bacterium]MBQ7119823.1 hypothetical protein [Oscillospiraceae bacterium]
MRKTEYTGNGGFLQRDSVEHEEYAEAYSIETKIPATEITSVARIFVI